MKHLYIVLLLTVTIGLTSCKAQIQGRLFKTVDLISRNSGNNDGKYFKDIDNDFAPFLGVWESTYGNITFRLTLFKTGHMQISSGPTNYFIDKIEAETMLIQDAGQANETILCQSEQWYNGSVMFAETYDGIELKGTFHDQCATNIDKYFPKLGHVKMDIIDPNAQVLTANWRLFTKDMSIAGQEFGIPTDVVLTKMK